MLGCETYGVLPQNASGRAVRLAVLPLLLGTNLSCGGKIVVGTELGGLVVIKLSVGRAGNLPEHSKCQNHLGCIYYSYK